MTKIHPTAIVENGAQLGVDVEIGPYCVVGPEVVLGDGTQLQSHVVVTGKTTIGAENVIYPFASLGQPSPDRKYAGEEASLVVGDRNDIREYVTMHIGTGADRGETTVGSDNLLMSLTHIAHDCVVGNNCIFANGVHLAGHVVVEDDVVIGGLSGVLQKVRVGQHAIIGGHSGVDKDVLPYSNVAGKRATLGGLNLVGLRRRGFSKESIHALQAAYDHLFEEMDGQSFSERVQELATQPMAEEVAHLIEFLNTAQRGITRPEEDV